MLELQNVTIRMRNEERTLAELFDCRRGAFILELSGTLPKLPDNVDVLDLGETLVEPMLYFGREALPLDGLQESWEDKLESVYPVNVKEVSHFGIMTGVWEDKRNTVLHVTSLMEKPKSSYAEEFLGVRDAEGQKEYCSVFGQYILTPEVFAQLEADIQEADAHPEQVGEIELTSALDKVRQRTGMYGIRLRGERFDMGNPPALMNTVATFAMADVD